MALGSRTSPKQDARREAGTHDASLDYEASPVSKQDACWLALIQTAIDLAESPRYCEINDDGKRRTVLVSKKFWSLKSAYEYAKMEPHEIHPAVLIQMDFLIRSGKCQGIKSRDRIARKPKQ